MPQIIQKLKKILKKIQFKLFSTMLPQGGTEFNEFYLSLSSVYDLPDSDGYRRMVAAMIQHLPSNQYRVKKHQLYVSIKRAIANEVAFYIIKELNDKAKTEANAATSVQ